MGAQRLTLMGLGPALVLQWTLHGPTIHTSWPFIEHYHFLNFYRVYIRFQALITFWKTCLSLGVLNYARRSSHGPSVAQKEPSNRYLMDH